MPPAALLSHSGRTSSRPSPALGRRGTEQRESRTARGPAGGMDRAPGVGRPWDASQARGRCACCKPGLREPLWRTPRRPCCRSCRPRPSSARGLQAALLRPPLRLRTSCGGSELLPFFRSEISDLIELTVRNRCILSRRCRPSQTPRLTRSSCPKGHLARKKRLGLSSTQRNKITLKVAAFYRRSRSHFRISN